MLWQGRRESENVEDVRGSSGGRRLGVGGGIGPVVLVITHGTSEQRVRWFRRGDRRASP
jgi:predicted metalloprotease